MMADLKSLKDKTATGASISHQWAFLSDALLWLILAGVLCFAVYFYAVRMPERRGQQIILHFQDANEISQGSAVHMMGIDVGYVDQVRILRDSVAITIRTYPGALPIPRDARFTILFTGLAGAKSIEIELPDNPNATGQCQARYRVEEPIRLKHLLNANIEITQALQGGAENIADFFGKQKPVEELQFNIRQAHAWSLETLDFVSALSGGIGGLTQEVHANSRFAVNTLTEISQGFHLAVVKTRPGRIRPLMSNGLASLRSYNRLFASEADTASGATTLAQKIDRFNAGAGHLSAWLDKARRRVALFPLERGLMGLEAGLDDFDALVTHADAAFPDNPVPPLCRVRQNIQRLNRQVTLWDDKLAASNGKGAPVPGEGKSRGEKDATTRTGAIAIVDRNGQPIGSLKGRWWEEPDAETREALPGDPPQAQLPAPPARVERRFFLVRWFHTVWDACLWLFR